LQQKLFITGQNGSLNWSRVARAAYFHALHLYTHFVLFKLGLQVLTFVVYPPDALVAALTVHLRSIEKTCCEKFGLFWAVENIYDLFEKISFSSIGSKIVSEYEIFF